jgi:transcription antitermination factor NusG
MTEPGQPEGTGEPITAGDPAGAVQAEAVPVLADIFKQRIETYLQEHPDAAPGVTQLSGAGDGAQLIAYILAAQRDQLDQILRKAAERAGVQADSVPEMDESAAEQAAAAEFIADELTRIMDGFFKAAQAAIEQLDPETLAELSPEDLGEVYTKLFGDDLTSAVN